jgi:Fic family protein
MLLIEERLRYHDLNIDTLFELHATLTRDTIDDADVGRLRRDTDNIEVSDPVAGITYHIPPAAKFLKEELTRFVKYANDNLQKHVFVHPVIKAIILHFWVGYLHPFTDGNGRLARAVFYWYLLKKKYWAFAYLPLSKVIKNSPVQYGRAYVYSEQDDCDLTYFIDYNIRKISQAQREFGAYVSKKQGENSRMAELAQSEFNLNDRQIQLLRYLHKNPEATTTIKTHSHVYEISRPTATKDLERLEQLGFLVSRRLGQKKPFRATEKTKELFD